MTQLNEVGTVATNVYTENGMTKVRYHKTVVVEFDEVAIILNNGGWKTQTTKNRMNQASNQFGLEFHVYQENFEWFAEFQGEAFEFENGRCCLLR